MSSQGSDKLSIASIIVIAIVAYLFIGLITYVLVTITVSSEQVVTTVNETLNYTPSQIIDDPEYTEPSSPNLLWQIYVMFFKPVIMDPVKVLALIIISIVIIGFEAGWIKI